MAIHSPPAHRCLRPGFTRAGCAGSWTRWTAADPDPAIARNGADGTCLVLIGGFTPRLRASQGGTIGRHDRAMDDDPGTRSPLTSVVLRDLQDDDGFQGLRASRGPGGAIRIDGHDLGRGVDGVFGAGLSESEWCWTVEPDAVPAAVAALDGWEGDDPLRLLAAWSAAHGGNDPGSHLRDAGVPIAFWNRIGD